MAERSQPWDTNATGDGPSGGYTETQTEEFFRDLFSGDRYTTDGVLPGNLNQLAVTSATNQVTVASGAAIVYGKYYQNTSSLNTAVTSPTTGTTGLRVVLRASWAAQTVRVTVVKNTDGTSAAPAATQTAGTTWDITLATGTITTGGSISLTDAREFLHMPTALVHRRQGGSATDWATAGTTNYTPGEAFVQVGAVSVSFTSGTGSQAVTFPVAFSGIPVVLLTVDNAASSTKRKLLATIETVSASSLTIRIYMTDESTSSSSATVYWLAVGPS